MWGGRCFYSHLFSQLAMPPPLAERLQGDPRAQALSDQLSGVDKQFGFRFFNETRRSWVMSLPTESGEKVLKAFCSTGLRDEGELELRLRAHVMMRWRALEALITAKTDPVQFVASSASGSGASGGSGVSAGPPMPVDLDAIPHWYEEQYESRLGRRKEELRRMNDPAWNPGRTWRLGLAAQVFGSSPTYEYYPGGVPGTQLQKKKRSNRKNTGQDAVRPGELYQAPADVSDRLVEAIEEPGVLAGFSAVHNLPDIVAAWRVTSGYVYCPLRVRLDHDRVHRQVHASGEFQSVRPIGSGGGPFKEEPWGHMTPYKTGFSYKGMSGFQLGTTDEGSNKPSSSGARLWMSGPEMLVAEAFCKVVRLLPQDSFDDRDTNYAQCRLTDGKLVRWAAMSDERVHNTLGLPFASTWATMPLKEQVKAIRAK